MPKFTTSLNPGILLSTKCVIAKHNGTQMTQSRAHFTIGYSTTGLNNKATATMIGGWNVETANEFCVSAY